MNRTVLLPGRLLTSIATLVVLVVLAAVPASGDTKTETILRIQQEQITRMQAELDHARADLAATNKRTTTAASNNTTAVNTAREAMHAQITNAAEAQIVAVAAEAHNVTAVENAEQIKQQNDLLIRNTETSKFALYGTLSTGILTFATVVVGLVFKDRSDKRALQMTLTHRRDELIKIEEVGIKADKAYEVGNTVNAKLETIGVQMADGKPLSPSDTH